MVCILVFVQFQKQTDSRLVIYFFSALQKLALIDLLRWKTHHHQSFCSRLGTLDLLPLLYEHFIMQY